MTWGMGVINTYDDAHKQHVQSTQNPNTDDILMLEDIEKLVIFKRESPLYAPHITSFGWSY